MKIFIKTNRFVLIIITIITVLVSFLLLGFTTNALKKQELKKGYFDVIVVGSEPEGIAAALGSAREGASTLLIDSRDKVGGLFTLGELNSLDMSYIKGTQDYMTKGIFKEFFELIGSRTSFDIEDAENAFEQMITKQENLVVVKSAKDIYPEVSGRNITKLLYTDKDGVKWEVEGKRFIDSTQNADFANIAGAPFTKGIEDFRNRTDFMGVTQVFELGGVDWKEIQNYLWKDGFNDSGADNHSAYGYKQLYKYVTKDPDMRMRGLNIGRLNNGNILINALIMVGVDGTDDVQVQNAQKRFKKELTYLIKEINKLPALENAYLVRVAPELYIRETRHLEGLYRLTIDDVLENRDFYDRIAFGSYPLDIQFSKYFQPAIVGNPEKYAVPFRAIVPKNFNNLLVASRSASYDSLAHGSARTVPTGMCVGQAAGVASAYSIEAGLDFQQIALDQTGVNIASIQKRLNEKGAELEPFTLPMQFDPESYTYKAIKYHRSMGLIFTGYDNNYKLNETMKIFQINSFMTNLNNLKNNSDLKLSKYKSIDDKAEFTFIDLMAMLKKNEININWLSYEFRVLLGSKKAVDRETVYALMYEIYEKRIENEKARNYQIE